jgi:hypothetical protein
MPAAACCSETNFSGGTTGISAAYLMDAEGLGWCLTWAGSLGRLSHGGRRARGVFDSAQTVSGSEDILIAPPGAAVWQRDSRGRSRDGYGAVESAWDRGWREKVSWLAAARSFEVL